ncbi:MAG: hypothetical protein WCW33_03470 [Candidatus Babeliales bacterium]|jgi:hypothetical protein
MKIIFHTLLMLLFTAPITFLNTQTPEATTNQQWKEDVQKKFTEYLTFLRSIIDQGETSEEIKDFAQYFTQLESWFTTTLAQLSSPTDSNYEVLTAKMNALAQLIEAQKSAEVSLKSMVGNAATIAEVFPRLRLSLLYEINLLLSKKMNVHDAALKAAQNAARCIPEKEDLARLENIIEINLRSCIEEKNALKQKLVRELEQAGKENLSLQTHALQNAQKFSIIQEHVKNLKLGIEQMERVTTQQDGGSSTIISEPEQARRAFIELELTQSIDKEAPKK